MIIVFLLVLLVLTHFLIWRAGFWFGANAMWAGCKKHVNAGGKLQ